MQSPTAPPILSARDVTATLSGDAGDVRVLDGVSLQVASGEIVDIAGPSGSGKTTLVLAIARLLPGAHGRLELDGRPAEEFAPQSWRAKVALLPQKPAMVAGTVRDNLLLPWSLKIRAADKPPADEVLADELARMGLGDIGLDRDAVRLSVGQQARVALGRVVLSAPRVLLLDEPDAALDDASASSVAAVAREFAAAGGGVVRVRHRGSDGVAHRRLELRAGRLAEVGL